LGQAKDCDDTLCLPAPQVIDAEEVIIHPGWNPKNYFAGNDIALVRLEEPAVLHFVSAVDAAFYDHFETQRFLLH
jgi:hypothetical protein